MGKGVSKEDVAQMMHSVVSVSTDIYPLSYDADYTLMKMIYPYILEKGVSPKGGGTVQIEISYNALLKCIDDTYGIKNYLDDFKKDFDADKGIEANYEKLTERYSSVEILLLYGVFKNLVYINFNVHFDKDERKGRERNMTVLRLPDLRIGTMSIKLRDFCDQNMTDAINQYAVTNTGFEDNVMSRKNVFMTESLTEFFTLLHDIGKDLENAELGQALYELFSFLDIDEIKNTTLLIVTDWPVL